MKYIIIILGLAFYGVAFAQSNDWQDESVTRLASKYSEYISKRETSDGYRIQITYTDIREEAYKSKAGLYRQFPELASYIEYETPYYKLRVGDFKTRLEATYYLQQIILYYPGAFIVRDNIKVK